MAIENPILSRQIEQQTVSFEGPDQLSLKTVPTLEQYNVALQQHNNEAYQKGYTAMVDIAKALKAYGGRALLVGGAVRDMVQGSMVKDFDLEVYDLSPEIVTTVAEKFGAVSEVGKAFGILKVATPSGIDLDIALPRRDSKTGAGHRGFAVTPDATMSITEACRRRDFTINAMAADPINGKVYDPFNGWEDLQEGILRVVDAQTFIEDPLRVLRAMQFAGRFQLKPDAESLAIMRTLVPQLAELPKERFLEEWKKLLLKSEIPSVGLQLAADIGIFDVMYKQFDLLKTTEQDPKWHPEGDVFTHTKLAIDQAAKIVKHLQLPSEEAFVVMLATMCHDLGKPVATQHQENGAITSYGHEEAGVAPTKQFLDSIGVDTATREKVVQLVRYHMWPHTVFSTYEDGQSITDGAFRKLATRLAPATMAELAALAQADATGTGFYVDEQQKLHSPVHFPEGEWLLQRSEDLKIKHSKPETLIRGQDLLALGLNPGKEFGTVIQLADQLRDEQGLQKEAVMDMLKDVKTLKEAIAGLTQKLESQQAVTAGAQ